MALPEFFAQAPRIGMHDPLAEFLGAAQGGLLKYCYADAVRLAGHSCPTVAGAYLMVRAVLRVLHPDGPAERGGVAVTMSAAEDEGATGVIAQVFTRSPVRLPQTDSMASAEIMSVDVRQAHQKWREDRSASAALAVAAIQASGAAVHDDDGAGVAFVA